MSTPVIDKLEIRRVGETVIGNELKLQDGEVALIFRPGTFGPDILTTIKEGTDQVVMPDVIEASPFLMAAMISLLFYGGPNCQRSRHFLIDQTMAVLTEKGLTKDLKPDGQLPN